MRQSKTLKTQSLRLDLVAMAMIIAVIIAAAWVVYDGLEEQFLKNSIADASNAGVFIDSELSHAQEQLSLFAKVPAAQRRTLAERGFDTFSDLYALDDQGRVTTIYKTKPQSRLFEGYAFSAGPVWRQLLQSSNVARVSSIVAGYEDGAPSIYVAYRTQTQIVLGRLNLSYIQNFINQYSRITGNVLLLTTDKGVVMISGRPELVLPRLDMPALDPNIRPSQPITLDNQRWVPVISDSPALGAYLAVLVPTRLLDQQRNTMLIALAVVLAGLLLIVLTKHRKLDDKVLEPLSQLVTRIRRIEAGEPITDLDKPKPGMPTELAEINRHVVTMSQAIAERESKLTSTAAALATRESELSLILEHLPVPLIVFESADEHLITFTNASFLDALGYNTTEARSLLNLFSHTCQDADTAQRVSQAIEAMIHAHRNTNVPADPIEVSIQCRSGIQHDFIVSAISLQNTAIATLVDVTALRQSQRALLDAKVKAEKQEREQSQFLAMMSHEIRTPLTSILGITELLAQDELNARSRDLVNRLENVNQLLLRIVNDVLDHSKIEAGELNLQSYRFDLHELIAKCQGMFTKLAQDKGVSLLFDVQANCPVWRQADAFRLEQVLSNLLGNAIKFTEKGSVSVKVRCLDKANDPSWIRVEVSDTGIGIPKSLESLIFEPYKQIENESLRQLGGTGLGLAISKRIIHAMGGQIGLNTTPQVGTTFWLELALPLTTQPEAPSQRPSVSATQAQTKAQSQTHLRGAHILVVDDSTAIQFLIAEMLAPLSITCHSAADGLQALTLLKESSKGFDAVLMDIQMPNMDGIQCTRAIRQDSALKDLPIIAMTADLVGTQRQEMGKAGANEVLEKPLRQEHLLEILALQIEATPWRLFPHIAGIDRNHALQTMGQNTELFARLLRIFLQENANTVESLLKLIDDGDLDGALNQLNQLQAGASQIGALKLRDIAQQIEMSITSKAQPDTALIDAIDEELTQIDQSATREGLLP